MKYLWIVPAALAALGLLALLVSYICYRRAFYAPRNREEAPPEPLPTGEIYVPFYPQMRLWAQQMQQLPCRELTVSSHDGLQLYGKFYEYAPGAPIELMFHGYRGSAQRDLPGGVQRCFQLGHSALLVDQRCSGKSQGHTITFGILEHRDCLAWLKRLEEEFGPQQPIILTGISMGASTVLLAAGQPLPDNVIGILADCGYSDAGQIIRKVITDMGLPAGIAWPFVRLGAKLFGGFDPEADSPLKAMARCQKKVIFFHGQEDAFVPCQMSRDCYEACAAPKRLVSVPGAGHGLAYIVDPEAYLQALREFFP